MALAPIRGASETPWGLTDFALPCKRQWLKSAAGKRLGDLLSASRKVRPTLLCPCILKPY
jgi:hypothetical protein